MSDDRTLMMHPIGRLPEALADFDLVVERLGRRRPALFLDFDGTLTGIVDHPDDARLDLEARRRLTRIAERLTLAVISGRDRADVETRVGVSTIAYAGSHGFDIRLPPGVPAPAAAPVAVSAEHDRALDCAESDLRARLARFPGALVERKRYSLALHYRQVAPADEPGFMAAIDAVEAEQPLLRRRGGKKVVELQPRLDWDKGRAVLHLIAALDLSSRSFCPVFIGDDLTDEDAFGVLQERGLGVVVGGRGESDRPTTARFRLGDPDEVLTFLERLADLP